jgi:hypothetical protein
MTPLEPTELHKLHIAFDEVVQIRLMIIRRTAARAGQLPLDPVDNSPR